MEKILPRLADDALSSKYFNGEKYDGPIPQTMLFKTIDYFIKLKDSDWISNLSYFANCFVYGKSYLSFAAENCDTNLI